MVFACLWVCLLPQEEIIPKSQKDLYLKPAEDCDKALGLIDTDPAQAIDILTRIIENKKIEKKERRFKIEKATAEYTKVYEFHPYQYRGRARMALAKADKKNAETFLKAAIEDFRSSISAGLKSSESHLEAARAELEKIKAAVLETPKDDRERKFREQFDTLLRDKRFQAAVDFLAKADFLEKPRREKYAAEVEAASASHVAEALDAFLRSLELYVKPASLRPMKFPEFDRVFVLPGDEKVVGKYPALDWARRHRVLIDRVRQQSARVLPKEVEETVDALMAQMIAAEPLETKAENRWFRAGAELTFHYLEEVIRVLIDKSRGETPENRRKAKEAAEKLRARWVEVGSKLPREFLERHPGYAEAAKGLVVLVDGFPVDLEELDRIDLDKCFTESSPDAALERVERDLAKMRGDHGDALSADSLRKLLTLWIAASAMRKLLAGEVFDDVVRDLRDLGKDLKKAGGPTETRRWGPKIEKVFEALR